MTEGGMRIEDRVRELAYPNLPMTSAEKLEAAYFILNEIQENYLYTSDLSGIDLALIVANLGYDFVKTSSVIGYGDWSREPPSMRQGRRIPSGFSR